MVGQEVCNGAYAIPGHRPSTEIIHKGTRNIVLWGLLVLRVRVGEENGKF